MPFLPKPKPKISPHRRRKTSEDRAGKRFLDSKAWKDTRKAQLGEAPYCEACMAAGNVRGLVKNAHIDHIVPRSHGAAPLDTRNLQTLCKYHHDRKNGLEKNRGCLVEFTGSPGERLPAPGEKERLIKLLIGINA